MMIAGVADEEENDAAAAGMADKEEKCTASDWEDEEDNGTQQPQ